MQLDRIMANLLVTCGVEYTYYYYYKVNNEIKVTLYYSKNVLVIQIWYVVTANLLSTYKYIQTTRMHFASIYVRKV